MRLKYIDILKGFAIFLVVFGHVIVYQSQMARLIFSFHMPLFFIISGYLFNFKKYENNFSQFFKGRFRRLILPYFTSVLLFFMYYLIYMSPKPFIETPSAAILFLLKNDIVSSLYGSGAINNFHITPVGPLWFLVALFCVEILFYFSLKLMKNSSVLQKYIFYFIISYSGVIIGQKIFLPWSFDISLVAIIFVFAGYELRKQNIIEKISALPNNIYLLIILISCILWYILSKHSFLCMSDRVYHNYFYIYIEVILASVVLFSLCYKIQNIQYFSSINKMFSFLGSETLIILIMHFRVFINTPQWSILRYNDLIFTIYIILFSLMIGLVIKQIPLLKNIYYPNINKKKEEQ